ncbi:MULTISPECIES: sugar ABC transporter ATP-binding protein [unclassified Roseitalea]|uniref:sugar ABC transporter ATP-binding protein n=1 Tax=unclassified Roseitalea TaxID=2639107 RepID=UPI00273D53DD|nr:MULTISPECIES: sugar ABC transporter ATP-binding protein [unclassified Roseitalea]
MEVLALSDVRKSFGGVTALAGVDLTLRAGEIHAVCGENGAGKSTFMKIVAGAELPDAGRYVLDGREVTLRSVADANQNGVGIVFQELSLFPDFDAVQNVFLGREPRRLGLIDRVAMEGDVAPLFDMLGLSVDLRAPVSELRIADQQLIEIAKALALQARVLILDEPNSALNVEESARLFRVVRDLRERGTGIFYISHRLEEVVALADRVSVLRNGLKVAEHPRESVTIGTIVRDMLGDKADNVARRTAQGMREPTSTDADHQLRVSGVSGDGILRGCSFTAAPGQVVGLVGLEGAGCEDVLDILFGRRRMTAGELAMPGGAGAPHSVEAAVRSGVALVPADRRTEGLALNQAIFENLNTVVTGALARLGHAPSRGRMTEVADRQAAALRLVHGGFANPVDSLSGGNQQKIVIGKWLAGDPRLVLLNDPTRGVDVGAKDEIYRIIDKLAEEGRIVLFLSSELTEYSLVCDRVLLFYEGRIIGELPGDEATEHAVLEAINIGRIAPAA